jgi:hypothetical protein
MVIEVLESQGITVSSTGEEDWYHLESDDGQIEVQKFPRRVKKRLLQYLKRRYGIPVHFFYQ